MRRRVVWMCLLAAVFCLAASSCGGASAQRQSEVVQSMYADMEHCLTQVKLSADFGDAINEFTLRYEYDRQGESVVEVVAPEEIKGLRAAIQEGDTKLVYEDLILETGPLPGTGLTPMDALPVMMRTWAEGYIFSIGEETLESEPCIRAVFKSTVAGVEIEQHAWFDPEQYKPLRAETFSAGTRVLVCEFETFEF